MAVMASTVVAVMILLVTSIQNIGNIIDNPDNSQPLSKIETLEQKAAETTSSAKAPPAAVSYKAPLAYGTKGLKGQTAELIEQAIATGFRHIVTCGHHTNHNETGVGIGWKASGIPRQELFLQTCFVPFDKNHQDFKKQPDDPDELPTDIEHQVKLSVEASLKNLQTDYVDALIFNNFRAKLWNKDEILKAWKVLETYVDQGTVKQLGLTSVHDIEWFESFTNSTRIKPTIVQNRFHSNRQYDVPRQETFAKHGIQVQRFWLLNGSSGYGKKNAEMAKQKGVTPCQLMLAFVMSMGSETCLVGPKALQHMKDDVEIARCYPSLFQDDAERMEYAKKLGMKQPSDRPLPGVSGVDFANEKAPKCQKPQ